MLLCVAMLFCSCGEEERAVLGYEQPVATLVTAAQYSDTQSYLSCFTPEAEAEYKNSDSYNESCGNASHKGRGKNGAFL